MKSILMSIKPIYSQMILRGEKDVEFRRVFGDAAAAADRVVIYESAPTMRIVGSFGIDMVDSPAYGGYGCVSAERIWCNIFLHIGEPGIDRETFDSYMDGAKSPCAIYLKDVVKLERPFSPKAIDPSFRPPQSYMWCPDWIAEICDADDGGASPY